MRVDDRVAVGKEPEKPARPPRTPTGVVNHSDPHSVKIDHAPLGQKRSERLLVVVTQDANHRREALELT